VNLKELMDLKKVISIMGPCSRRQRRRLIGSWREKLRRSKGAVNRPIMSMIQCPSEFGSA
jgi:hypothetical protein